MNDQNNSGAGRWALVTGASAGIGEAFAKVFAKNGFNLVLLARRKEKLEALAAEIEKTYPIKTQVLVADLSEAEAPRNIYNALELKQIRISVLVNNAGYAVKTGFTETTWQDHAKLIQVMMTAVTELCHLFAPDMKKQQYGRIINVASIAAFTPQMPGNLYGGVKSYVTCLSDALHMELSRDGVNCTAICPGFTKSEFHDVMDVRASINKLPAFMWMSAEAVADEGYRAVMKGKPICIPGNVNKAIASLMDVLPKSIKSKAGKKQNIIEV